MSQKNLSYLFIPPNSTVNPPAKTTKSKLPISELDWKDFERLCLRLVQTENSIDDCEFAGVEGGSQEGIDIFVFKENGMYETLQCKKYKTIYPNTLRRSVEKFKDGEWYSKSNRFYFCTNKNLSASNLQSEFNLLKNELKKDNIDFIKWDESKLNEKLKNEPKIVFDFFGAEWVKIFNGTEYLEKILKTNSLDHPTFLECRVELKKLYSTIFQTNDPGIPSNGFSKTRFLLHERYVIPDIEDQKITRYTNNELESDSENSQYSSYVNNNFFIQDHKLREENSYEWERPIRRQIRSPQSTLANVDAILGMEKKYIVLGDPGSGKTSLLRFVILDILSESPRLLNVAKRWGDTIPIWLPFAYISSSLSKNPNKNIPEIIRSWFESQNKVNLLPLINTALNDERLLLVIDGIDEWANESEAIIAIERVENESLLRNARVLYSSRPYGYGILKDNFQGTRELSLAKLSTSQQMEFTKNWCAQWASENDNTDVEYIDSYSNNIMDEIEAYHEFKSLSSNPLLLSILIDQKFKNSVLPQSRLKALHAITEQLIEKHPKKRQASAQIGNISEFEFPLEEVFCDLALFMQNNCHEGIISKDDARVVISEYLQNLMGYPAPKSKQIAIELLKIGANSSGILIEKSNSEIAFLHRQFQEYLASKCILESEKDDVISIIKNTSYIPSWHQVYYLFFSQIKVRQKDLFVEYLDLIQPIDNSSPDVQKYCQFLKYELSICLVNSPNDLSEKVLKEVQQEFEFETNPNYKRILWHIIIESTNNTKLRDTSCNYLFKYFPNEYYSHDYRLNALFNLPHEDLSILHKEFTIKTLINGNEVQKREASRLIARKLDDPFFKKFFKEHAEFISNPEIIPYLLNSVAESELAYQEKLDYLKPYENSYHPDIMFMVFKLKVKLQLVTPEDLNEFLKINSNTTFGFRIETLNILIDGWGKNEKLLEICLQSIGSKGFDRQQSHTLNSSIAWKIMFHCFNKNEKVLNAIIDEIDTQNFPFNGFGNDDLWSYLPHYFEKNRRLSNSIENWISKQQFSEPAISNAVLVGKTTKSRDYLLEKLDNSVIPHWFVGSLIIGWKNDPKVTKYLKSFFLKHGKNTDYAASFVNTVFEDEPDQAKMILEKILFESQGTFRNRALKPLIEIDPSYFEANFLQRYLENELPSLIEDDIFMRFHESLDVLSEFFADNGSLVEFVKNYALNDPNCYSILIRYYSDKFDLDFLFKTSLTLSPSFRLHLINNIDSRMLQSSIVLENLSKFNKETNIEIMTGAAMVYFGSQLQDHPENIIEKSNDLIFYSGHGDYLAYRQVAFCGYLIRQKLDDYYKQRSLKNNEIPKPNFQTHDNKLSDLMMKKMIDHFEYLIRSSGENFDLLFPPSEKIEERWAFWAKHTNLRSASRPHIMNYILSNIDSISNHNLIDFLIRVAPNSSALKKISQRMLVSENDRDSIFAGEILATFFSDDNELKQKLIFDEHEYPSGKILALLKISPQEDCLKIAHKNIKEQQVSLHAAVHYAMKFTYDSTDDVLAFLEKVVTNQQEANYWFQYYYPPLISRVKGDEELKQKMKNILFTTGSSSMRISCYSILKKVNYNEQELNEWKKNIPIQERKQFGYDLINNQLTSLEARLWKVPF